MHDTAYNIGKLVIEKYFGADQDSIVEIGSLDVNGSLRVLKPSHASYVGVDIVSGSSVDLIMTDPHSVPLPDACADLVIASSVFEHDSFFWLSFLEMCRLTKDGGHIYVNSPSNGEIHRYPQDCWRFYPDAGSALVNWASHNGINISLVESFICDRSKDKWNDFVAIFRVGQTENRQPENCVFSSLKCRNITWNNTLLHSTSRSEDMEIIDDLNTNLQSLEQGNRPLQSFSDAIFARDLVISLYTNVLNRLPSSDEVYNKMVEIDKANLSVNDVVKTFTNSEEFKFKYIQ